MKNSHVPLQIRALTRSGTLRPGQTDCVGRLKAVYTHSATYTHSTSYSLCAVLLQTPSSLRCTLSHAHTYRHRCVLWRFAILNIKCTWPCGARGAGGCVQSLYRYCVYLCVSVFASACSRVCLCRRAPPDYGCYIINSDQICFVA